MLLSERGDLQFEKENRASQKNRLKPQDDANNDCSKSVFDKSKLSVFCKTAKSAIKEISQIEENSASASNQGGVQQDQRTNDLTAKKSNQGAQKSFRNTANVSFQEKVKSLVQKQKSSLIEELSEKKPDPSPLNSILSMAIPTQVKKKPNYNKTFTMATQKQRPPQQEVNESSGSSLHLHKNENMLLNKINCTFAHDSSLSSQDMLGSSSTYQKGSKDFQKDLFACSYASTASNTIDNSGTMGSGKKSGLPNKEADFESNCEMFYTRHMSFQGAYQHNYPGYNYYTPTNYTFDYSTRDASNNSSFQEDCLDLNYGGNFDTMMYNNYESNVEKEEVRNSGRRKCRIDRDSTLFNVNLHESSVSGKTTLMIRNIPNKYTQVMMIQMIDKKFKDTYDFFYLPIDFLNKCNVGYAFINFKSSKYVEPFYNEMNNKKWDKFSSQKICEIKYARIQGKEDLSKHFENSRIMTQQDKKIKPNFVFGGEQQRSKQKLLFDY